MPPGVNWSVTGTPNSTHRGYEVVDETLFFGSLGEYLWILEEFLLRISLTSAIGHALVFPGRKLRIGRYEVDWAEVCRFLHFRNLDLAELNRFGRQLSQNRD
jgi:hypothetical protein